MSGPAPGPSSGATPSTPAPATPFARAALACLPCRQVKARCSGQPPPQLLQEDGKMIVVPVGSDLSAIRSEAGASTSSSAGLGASDFGASSATTSVPAEVPCERCARLGKRCVWAPSHRTGRPRKKQRTEPDERTRPPQARTPQQDGGVGTSTGAFAALTPMLGSMSRTTHGDVQDLQHQHQHQQHQPQRSSQDQRTPQLQPHLTLSLPTASRSGSISASSPHQSLQLDPGGSNAAAAAALLGLEGTTQGLTSALMDASSAATPWSAFLQSFADPLGTNHVSQSSFATPSAATPRLSHSAGPSAFSPTAASPVDFDFMYAGTPSSSHANVSHSNMGAATGSGPSSSSLSSAASSFLPVPPLEQPMLNHFPAIQDFSSSNPIATPSSSQTPRPPTYSLGNGSGLPGFSHRDSVHHHHNHGGGGGSSRSSSSGGGFVPVGSMMNHLPSLAAVPAPATSLTNAPAPASVGHSSMAASMSLSLSPMVLPASNTATATATNPLMDEILSSVGIASDNPAITGGVGSLAHGSSSSSSSNRSSSSTTMSAIANPASSMPARPASALSYVPPLLAAADRMQDQQTSAATGTMGAMNRSRTSHNDHTDEVPQQQVQQQQERQQEQRHSMDRFDQMLALRQRITGNAGTSYPHQRQDALMTGSNMAAGAHSSAFGPSASSSSQHNPATIAHYQHPHQQVFRPPYSIEDATQAAAVQMPAQLWEGLRHGFAHAAGACAILGKASAFVRSVGRASALLQRQAPRSQQQQQQHVGPSRYASAASHSAGEAEAEEEVEAGAGAEAEAEAARRVSATATLFAAYAACAIGFRLASKADTGRFRGAGVSAGEEAVRLSGRLEEEFARLLLLMDSGAGVNGLVGAGAGVGLRAGSGAGAQQQQQQNGAGFLLRGLSSYGGTVRPDSRRPSDAAAQHQRQQQSSASFASSMVDADFLPQPPRPAAAASTTSPDTTWPGAEAETEAESDGSFLLLRVLQGFLLMTHFEYGLGRPELAGRHLKKGIDIALRYGVHRLDAPLSRPGSGSSSLGAHSTAAGGAGLMQPSSSSHQMEGWRSSTLLNDGRKEELRRIWWEMYSTDLLLSLSTSNAVPRNLASIPHGTAMHMPLDLGVEASSSSMAGMHQTQQDQAHSTSASASAGARETMDVRIRATALLHEATLPTMRQLANVRTEEARLRAAHHHPPSSSSSSSSSSQHSEVPAAMRLPVPLPPPSPTPAEYARAEALDMITANLLVRAHNARMNVTQRYQVLLRREVLAEERKRKRRDDYTSGGGGGDGKGECLLMNVGPERDELRAASAEKESLFMAMLMLRAARIHLHRMLHFADLNINFDTCSLSSIRSFGTASTPTPSLQPARLLSMTSSSSAGPGPQAPMATSASEHEDGRSSSCSSSAGGGGGGMAFGRGGGGGRAPSPSPTPSSEDEYVGDQSIMASVRIITTSANEMVHLIREDYESVRRINATASSGTLTTSLPGRMSGASSSSAFASGAAPGSTGAAFGGGGGGGGEGILAGHTCPSTISPILRHGVFFGCSLVTAAWAYCVAIAGAQGPNAFMGPSFGAPLGRATAGQREHEVTDPERDGQLWRKRLLLSNLGF
ncbi:hypothetical protein OC844_003646, partial [Tilletia horrida]